MSEKRSDKTPGKDHSAFKERFKWVKGFQSMRLNEGQDSNSGLLWDTDTKSKSYLIQRLKRISTG